MLGEAETKALDSSLCAIRESDQRHHHDLHQLLGQFRLLLDSYNGLRSDYEKKEEELRQCKGLNQFEKPRNEVCHDAFA